MRTVLAALFLVWLPLATAQSSSSTRAFQIQSTNLPQPQAGKPYHFQLKAIGGMPPYHWRVLSHPLPPELSLDPVTGLISGTPQSSRAFSVLLEVSDSSQPPLTYSRLLTAGQNAPLSVVWTARPRVAAASLSGAVRVSNGSKDNYDVTVIVVAVNQFGKAFALRYEHLSLAPQTETPDLSFNSTLPLGSYTVHVDAVAEVPSKGEIYRQRLEQEGIAIQSQ
jgi:hypothetical protein